MSICDSSMLNSRITLGKFSACACVHIPSLPGNTEMRGWLFLSFGVSLESREFVLENQVPLPGVGGRLVVVAALGHFSQVKD